MTEHTIDKRVYYYVCAALMGLLALTVLMSFIDLGIFNVMIALTIAIIKAVLVVMYFMHARYSDHLVWVFIAAGIVWLSILMALTASDFLTRAWIIPSGSYLTNGANQPGNTFFTNFF